MERSTIINTARELAERTNKYAAMALPPAAVGAVAALVMYYAFERGDFWQSQTVWGGLLIPGWLSGGVFTALMAVFVAFLTYLIARHYPTAANMATIAGIATACALMWWPTQQCNQAGGITAGVVSAGTVIIVAISVKVVQKLRSRPSETQEIRATNEDATAVSGKFNIDTIEVIQISLAIYMGFIVLILLADELIALGNGTLARSQLTESRTEILIFAGIGLAGASILSAKLSLKNILAMSGVTVSLAGSFLEMYSAVNMDNSDINVALIMIVAGVLTFLPAAVVMILTANTVVVRIGWILIATVALLVALVMAMTAVIICVALIITGCGTLI